MIAIISFCSDRVLAQKKQPFIITPIRDMYASADQQELMINYLFVLKTESCYDVNFVINNKVGIRTTIDFHCM